MVFSATRSVVWARIVWLVAATPALAGVVVTVDEGTRYQTIEGWGTCLTFWGTPAGPDSLYHDPRFIQAEGKEDSLEH